MIVTTLVFGLVFDVQSFIVSCSNYGCSHIIPTGFITFIFIDLLFFIVFFPIGWLFAYLPSRVLANLFMRRRLGGVIYLFSGLMLGIFFLPLCAGFSFIMLSPPDGPSYLSRCVEFSLPMTIAGLIGGYAAWRCTRRMTMPTD
jgi:hypothetical protein